MPTVANMEKDKVESGSGVDTDTDTEGKRKRQQEREDYLSRKLFKKTPSRSFKEKKDEEDSEMIAMMRELMNRNADMMNEIKEIRREQKENHDQLTAVKQENENLKKEIKHITARMEDLEKERKRKNLIITGVKIDKNDENVIKNDLESFITRELKLNIKLRSARRIGEKTCVVETESMTDKFSILEKKSMLRSHQDRIYIESDLTKKEVEIQKQIRKTAKEEKDKGNQTKVGYKKLIVNGKEWRWNEEHDKLTKNE